MGVGVTLFVSPLPIISTILMRFAYTTLLIAQQKLISRHYVFVQQLWKTIQQKNMTGAGLCRWTVPVMVSLVGLLIQSINPFLPGKPTYLLESSFLVSLASNLYRTLLPQDCHDIPVVKRFLYFPY
jgi:hypothetical protein